MTTADVVIVGGGVIGAATAFHLASRGVTRVILCERQWLAAGAISRSSAGPTIVLLIPIRSIISTLARSFASLSGETNRTMPLFRKPHVPVPTRSLQSRKYGRLAWASRASGSLV